MTVQRSQTVYGECNAAGGSVNEQVMKKVCEKQSTGLIFPHKT